MSDPIFAHRRLARVYDELDPDRDDLEPYLALVEELGAASVLDIGCGTGELACRLAARGVEVIGVDPASASLDVARLKAHADQVQWVTGEVSALPQLSVDLAVMTGNVAQVFLDDTAWAQTLSAAHRALCPGGHLVFETRDPAARGWEPWTREQSIANSNTVEGPVESWVNLTRVDLPLVSFRWNFRFHSDGEQLTSDSTLRFRTMAELTGSLETAGFDVNEVRDAPDRPGKEWVFVTTRT